MRFNNGKIKMNMAGVLIKVGMLAVILCSMLLVSACGSRKVNEEHLFLKNDRGTYNRVELYIPEGDGKKPVVLIAHGFAGTLHSGGAVELATRLAKKGTLAILIDFNPYEKADLKAERTDSYPLRNMESDAVNALKTVVKEHDGDPEKVSLYGRSYGGRLVMKMANESAGGFDYRRLALVAPAGDDVAFHRYLGGDEMYEKMREEAFGGKGYAEKLGLRIEKEWFEDVEDYNPCDYGNKFGDKPVLLFYNTKDTIVYPDTSVRCAEAYNNHEIVKVTTDDGHGYEMGYKESELKDMIMDRLVEFLG